MRGAAHQRAKSMNNQKLTSLYLAFYTPQNETIESLAKPLMIAQKAIMKADKQAFATTEALAEVVAGQVFAQLGKPSHQLVTEFANYFTVEVFSKAFNGDRAKLNGRQFDLLKNACAAIAKGGAHG